MDSAPAVSLVRTVRAAVIKSGMHTVFASRLRRAGARTQRLMIASPWISETLQGDALGVITSVIRRYSIPTYVFTREPDKPSHQAAIASLSDCPSVEIVMNPNLHAKVYACVAPPPYGFALLGSANLTGASGAMYEIGLIVLVAGGGHEVVKELASFGLDYLRTRPESLVLKKLSTGRR